MHGVVTDNDVLLYQNAFTSTKGNDAMACILFNQMRDVKLVTKVEVYKKVIQVLATSHVNTEEHKEHFHEARDDVEIPAANAIVHANSALINNQMPSENAHVDAPGHVRVPDVNHEDVSSDSDDDTPLLTSHYKKPKMSDPLATEPWASPSDLDTLGNVAFYGVMSPGVYVVLRRDYNGCKGITVLFSKGRHGRDVVRGFIPHEILCKQPCPGMQKLTEYIKAGRAIAAKKGGIAPIVSPEEIFKYVKKNPAKNPVH